ncbi:MAG: zf-TFIIB domain-containing protein [Thermodesulfobacteriota bacterium]
MKLYRYRSIKIYKCSGCEGVWLDAGELEGVSKLEKTGLDKCSASSKNEKIAIIDHKMSPLV